MFFDPVLHGFEEALGKVLLEEGHATGVGEYVREKAAERRAEGCEEDEEKDVGVVGGVKNDEDVGDAGDGERDEGTVDGGDEDEAGEAEVKEDVHHPVVGGGEEQRRDR